MGSYRPPSSPQHVNAGCFLPGNLKLQSVGPARTPSKTSGSNHCLLAPRPRTPVRRLRVHSRPLLLGMSWAFLEASASLEELGAWMLGVERTPQMPEECGRPDSSLVLRQQPGRSRNLKGKAGVDHCGARRDAPDRRQPGQQLRRRQAAFCADAGHLTGKPMPACCLSRGLLLAPSCSPLFPSCLGHAHAGGVTLVGTVPQEGVMS